MAYPNLSAEMRRFGISQEELASRIGRTPETVSRWMTGKNPISVKDAFKVKETCFPTLAVDYLFADEPIAAVS